MFNPLLKTFLAVAECGSFLQASEKLFLSTPAVMKQINQYEKHFGFKLFDRSNQGVKLTDEGKIIFDQAKNFIQLSNEVTERAEKIHEQSFYQIRIGSSLLYPANSFIDFWNNLGDKKIQIRWRIIPFEDSETDSAAHVVGSKCDIVVGAFNATKNTNNCKFFQLGSYNFCLAMPMNHILAKKNLIKPTDLANQRLLIMSEGNSPKNDAIRSILKEDCPDITFVDVPIHYAMEHFHRCEEENCLLLTLDGWKNVHPSLVTVPLEVEVKLPYGVLYSTNANKTVLKFLQILQKSL